MKKHLIIETSEFNGPADYIAKVKHLDNNVAWDAIITWRDLCSALGINRDEVANGKARPAIDRVAKDLAEENKPKDEKIFKEEVTKLSDFVEPEPKKEVRVKAERKSVATKVKVEEIKDIKEEKLPVTTQVTANQVDKVGEIETKKVAPQNRPVPTKVEDVAAQIADMLRDLNIGTSPEISEKLDYIKELVEYTGATVSGFEKRIEELEEQPSNVKTIQVKVNERPTVEIEGLVHHQFETILTHVSVGDHLMLVGPAGSGKTTVCEQVAQALNLDFYCKSVCNQTSKSELLGYMDANGNYVETDFRRAYENGGVFVLDEVDAGNANVISVLNSALSNGVCSFADKMVAKSDDFIVIACANTFGMGADRMYVGRVQLDAATLDRFSVIDFGYDEELEITLSGDEKWAKFVQAVRKELISERVVISPRATIQGAKLLAAGMNLQKVVDSRITKGMPETLKARVSTILKKYYPSSLK